MAVYEKVINSFPFGDTILNDERKLLSDVTVYVDIFIRNKSVEHFVMIYFVFN